MWHAACSRSGEDCSVHCPSSSCLSLGLGLCSDAARPPMRLTMPLLHTAAVGGFTPGPHLTPASISKPPQRFAPTPTLPSAALAPSGGGAPAGAGGRQELGDEPMPQNAASTPPAPTSRAAAANAGAAAATAASSEVGAEEFVAAQRAQRGRGGPSRLADIPMAEAGPAEPLAAIPGTAAAAPTRAR